MILSYPFLWIPKKGWVNYSFLYIMNTQTPQELVISTTQLEAHIRTETSWEKKREDQFRERLGVPVNLEKNFADLSALYKKIYDLLTKWSGVGAYDVAEVTTHIVMELLQWERRHRLVDAWSIWSTQKFFVGNVWVWPELADYRSLSDDFIAPTPLPNPPKENPNYYRAMACASYANAIVHTHSWRVLELQPLDIILLEDGKVITGTSVSEIVAQRMIKYAEKMRAIVRD